VHRGKTPSLVLQLVPDCTASSGGGPCYHDNFQVRGAPEAIKDVHAISPPRLREQARCARIAHDKPNLCFTVTSRNRDEGSAESEYRAACDQAFRGIPETHSDSISHINSAGTKRLRYVACARVNLSSGQRVGSGLPDKNLFVRRVPYGDVVHQRG
jgi:hypothetical protein